MKTMWKQRRLVENLWTKMYMKTYVENQVFSPNRPCENLCGKLVENKALFWRSCVKNACAQRESKPRYTITLPEERVKTT